MMRYVFDFGTLSSWARCQPMASPSRSGSVAMYSAAAPDADFLS